MFDTPIACQPAHAAQRSADQQAIGVSLRGVARRYTFACAVTGVAACDASTLASHGVRSSFGSETT